MCNNVLTAFSVRIELELGKLCKNYDVTRLYHYINSCRAPPKIFEHSAFQPRVQTSPKGPGRCLSMKKTRVIPLITALKTDEGAKTSYSVHTCTHCMRGSRKFCQRGSNYDHFFIVDE